MSRKDFECGVWELDTGIDERVECERLGRNLRMYGVELVLPCPDHFTEEHGKLRDFVVGAFEAGVKAGMEFERIA